jgi:hypothetical protein
LCPVWLSLIQFLKITRPLRSKGRINHSLMGKLGISPDGKGFKKARQYRCSNSLYPVYDLVCIS